MSSRTLKVALVGNPNAGKTSVFNALTAQHRHVGNFPGVTVDLHYGFCRIDEARVAQVIDLPGCYSSVATTDDGPHDERLACRSIHGLHADVWLNVVDACHLHRHLYLTLQLLEAQRPVVLVLNRMDLAEEQGVSIDVKALSEQLGVPVIPTSMRDHRGLEALHRAMVAPLSSGTIAGTYFPPELQISSHDAAIWEGEPWRFWRALEGDVDVLAKLTEDQQKRLKDAQHALDCRLGEQADIALADARYRQVQHMMQSVCQARPPLTQPTIDWDHWLLHPVLGLLVFLIVMYLTFWVTMGLGRVLQDGMGALGQLWLVDGLASLMTAWGHVHPVIYWGMQGLGVGLTTTLTFMPLIGLLFMALTVLEDSGYMARAVFLMDRWMARLGLPGRSFVAMIMGLGCNVPAVMASRTCVTEKERIMTAMMAPFMSCGARLTLYTVLIGAFFHEGGYRVVFSLYLLGIIMAMFTAWVLRKTLLKGDVTELIMELPLYQQPMWRHVWRQGWRQSISFLKRGCRWVMPVTALLSVLTHMHGHPLWDECLKQWHAWGACLFKPMGLQADNWPAMVALVTGVVAKEVVVSTLNSLYLSASDTVHHALSLAEMGARSGRVLTETLMSLWPWHAWHPTDTQLSPLAYRTMIARFGDSAAALSYSVFVLLYMPCISTLAAIARELSASWACFSLAWSLVMAYVAAVWCYQGFHLSVDPLHHLMIMGASGLLVMLFLGALWIFCRWQPRA